MAIWVDIDAKTGVPIFQQVVEQVKRAIATGMLKPGEQLPTVRELAEEHSINPNTIAKAYQNLKLLGLVTSRPGVGGGIFVAENAESSARDTELKRYQEELRKTVRTGYNLGLDKDELDSRFHRELNEWYDEHPPPNVDEKALSGNDVSSGEKRKRG